MKGIYPTGLPGSVLGYQGISQSPYSSALPSSRSLFLPQPRISAPRISYNAFQSPVGSFLPNPLEPAPHSPNYQLELAQIKSDLASLKTQRFSTILDNGAVNPRISALPPTSNILNHQLEIGLSTQINNPVKLQFPLRTPQQVFPLNRGIDPTIKIPPPLTPQYNPNPTARSPISHIPITARSMYPLSRTKQPFNPNPVILGKNKRI